MHDFNLKNVYIDKLDDVVNKSNNTYHGTSKIKRVDVKPSTHFDFNKENDKEGPKFKIGDHVRILRRSKFKIGDHVRILKYKNMFPKGYIPNWSEEVFVIIS